MILTRCRQKGALEASSNALADFASCLLSDERLKPGNNDTALSNSLDCRSQSNPSKSIAIRATIQRAFLVSIKGPSVKSMRPFS